MTQLFKNNAVSALVGAIAAADTLFNVANGELFPAPAAGEFFLVTLIRLDTNGNESGWEIVKVTARTGNTLTVVRAQEGTTGQSWPDGTLVDARLTAGSLTGLKASDSSKLEGVAPSPDALAHLGASGAFSFRNKIINGDFRVWQLGSGFDNPAGGYTADQWIVAPDSLTGASFTISRVSAAQEAADWATVDILRLGVSSVGAMTFIDIKQRIEGVGTFQNRPITLSFSHRFGARGKRVVAHIIQNFGASGSAPVATNIGAVEVGSTDPNFSRISLSATVPSIQGKTLGASNYLEIIIRVFAPDAGDFFDLMDVQTEAGETATPFERRPVGLEMLLCKRYLADLKGGAGRIDVDPGKAVVGVSFGVPMRTTPSIILPVGASIHEMSIAGRAIVSIVTAATNNSGGYIRFQMTTAGTSGNACNIDGGVYADARL